MEVRHNCRGQIQHWTRRGASSPRSSLYGTGFGLTRRLSFPTAEFWVGPQPSRQLILLGMFLQRTFYDWPCRLSSATFSGEIGTFNSGALSVGVMPPSPPLGECPTPTIPNRSISPLGHRRSERFIDDDDENDDDDNDDQYARQSCIHELLQRTFGRRRSKCTKHT